MSQKWYQSSKGKVKVSSVALPDWGHRPRDVTNWYQSQGFDTEPGWAMLVVSETRFQRELLLKGTKLNCKAFQSAKRIPWSCYEAQEV
jgi:hypothetical protein